MWKSPYLRNMHEHEVNRGALPAVVPREGDVAYLRMLSRFHEYSSNNVTLIMAQFPTATKVNSYDRWQSLDRQVMKGQKGIEIFFPYKRLVEDEETGEKRPS